MVERTWVVAKKVSRLADNGTAFLHTRVMEGFDVVLPFWHLALSVSSFCEKLPKVSW